MKYTYTLILFCSLLLVEVGCKKKKTDDIPSSGPSDDLKRAALANYSAIVYASYSDALTTAQAMQVSINAFVAAPDATKLQACKDAWLAARIPYEQTETYRFYDGPIDDANGPEGIMNAWPLDENYIDYTTSPSPTNNGIIQNSASYPVINDSLIVALNTVGGETNVSTGYHAIEFLLWGQDLSTTGPGARPYTDYTTYANATRRGQYLKACADLLVTNLQYVVDAWSPFSTSNYRATFTSAAPNESLKKIIQGMGFFSKGELAGQRMSVALETQLQEQEHSCFSDNTHNDIRYGSKGIQNVYLGTYTQVNGQVITGTSIKDVLAAQNATLANQIATTMQTSVTDAYAIPIPFDQDILGGSSTPNGAKVEVTIESLRAQADQLVQAASELGLGSITVE